MNTKYTGPIKEVEVVEKVFLTAEQVNSMKAFLDDNGNDKEHLVDWFVANRDFRHSVDIEYRGLADLKTSTLSKALYVGYSIEPEQPKFRAGDKVFVEWLTGGKVHQVAAVKKDGQVILQRDYGLNCLPNMHTVRHATPEEIYWLETLGRNSVKDFRIGDIYIDREYRAEILENDRHVQLAQICYADEDFKGLYPAESFRLFKKE